MEYILLISQGAQPKKYHQKIDRSVFLWEQKWLMWYLRDNLLFLFNSEEDCATSMGKVITPDVFQ